MICDDPLPNTHFYTVVLHYARHYARYYARYYARNYARNYARLYGPGLKTTRGPAGGRTGHMRTSWAPRAQVTSLRAQVTNNQGSRPPDHLGTSFEYDEDYSSHKISFQYLGSRGPSGDLGAEPPF